MLGMAGDGKNTGSLIINIDHKPEGEEKKNNSDTGLVSSGREIMQAIRANDADSFTRHLKSFINVCIMESKRGNSMEKMEHSDYNCKREGY